MIRISKGTMDLINSYYICIAQIAQERKYIAQIHPIPLETLKNWENMIIEKKYPQYFAIDNKQVVGFSNIIPKPADAMDHVGTLGMGVLKDYRHQGIGSHLLHETICSAKAKKLEKVELEVFESNVIAVKFYEKYQFIREGVLIHGRKLDGVYDNIVLMARFL